MSLRLWLPLRQRSLAQASFQSLPKKQALESKFVSQTIFRAPTWAKKSMLPIEISVVRRA
jgi:hypothetical protein